MFRIIAALMSVSSLLFQTRLLLFLSSVQTKKKKDEKEKKHAQLFQISGFPNPQQLEFEQTLSSPMAHLY